MPGWKDSGKQKKGSGKRQPRPKAKAKPKQKPWTRSRSDGAGKSKHIAEPYETYETHDGDTIVHEETEVYTTYGDGTWE